MVEPSGSATGFDSHLRFDDEGTLLWFDGCDDLTRPVEVIFGSEEDPAAVDAGELIFGGGRSPRRECSDVVRPNVQQMSDVLSGRPAFLIYGDSLTIEADDGASILLRAAE